MSKIYDSRDAETLLQQHGLLVCAATVPVSFTGISNNSKETQQGDLFICKGFRFRPEYLLMAAENGATCYLSQEEIPGVDLPFILVRDVRKAQSVLARWFYGDPSRAFSLAGVTGTKGKTTTTHMIHGVMDAVKGQDTGYLSGIEHFVGGDVYAAHLSTPESLELQKLYAEARDHALPFVTSEISSQAYKVDRVFGQHFDYGVFLNISPDHISPFEHPDMADYLACKTALLRNSTVSIICRDTDYFDSVYAAAKESCKKVYLVGEEADCDFRIHDICRLRRGYSFQVTERESGETYTYSTPIDGVFNVKNATCAIAIGRLQGGSPEVIAAALQDLTVPGRGDIYEGGGVTVLVNYMHNGVSCRAVLERLTKEYPGAYITVVIGIRGHRSPQRLKDVGEICGNYADRIFFTMDNPDYDDPKVLAERLAEAAAGRKANVTVEPNRIEAVRQAIMDAPENSLVVLAGRGAEDTQRVCGEQVPYESDPSIAQRVLPLREKMK